MTAPAQRLKIQRMVAAGANVDVIRKTFKLSPRQAQLEYTKATRMAAKQRAMARMAFSRKKPPPKEYSAEEQAAIDAYLAKNGVTKLPDGMAYLTFFHQNPRGKVRDKAGEWI